jgi:hypothetical protein
MLYGCTTACFLYDAKIETYHCLCAGGELTNRIHHGEYDANGSKFCGGGMLHLRSRPVLYADAMELEYGGLVHASPARSKVEALIDMHARRRSARPEAQGKYGRWRRREHALGEA